MNRFTPLLISLVLCVAAGAVYGWLSFETSLAISSASAASAEAATSGARALYAQSVSGLLRETADERSQLAAFVATDQSAPAIIQELGDAAKYEQVSATIGTVSVLASDWKQYEPLEIQLSARGSFAALAALATDLESLPQVSHLSSFTIQSSGNRVWFATYTVDFVKQKSSPTS